MKRCPGRPRRGDRRQSGRNGRQKPQRVAILKGSGRWPLFWPPHGQWSTDGCGSPQRRGSLLFSIEPEPAIEADALVSPVRKAISTASKSSCRAIGFGGLQAVAWVFQSKLKCLREIILSRKELRMIEGQGESRKKFTGSKRQILRYGR